MDDYSIFLASNGYYQHLAMNDWVSATKRVENFDTYGLAIVDFHYLETTHLNLQGRMVSIIALIISKLKVSICFEWTNHIMNRFNDLFIQAMKEAGT